MMNSLEKQMLALLVELRRNCGACYVRAEFESEGLRVEDVLRLKNVASRAGLALSLTIGGCEGKRDLIESKDFGAEMIVAPMVESAFALRKYEQAALSVYSHDELEGTTFWFSLETIAAVSKSDNILASESASKMAGAVVDRVDLCRSLGMAEEDADAAEVSVMVSSLVRKAKAAGLETIVGGGVTSRSFDLFSTLIAERALDFFETRKVGFATDGLTSERYMRALSLAIGFELLFLRDKISGGQDSAAREADRLAYLETTYRDEIESALCLPASVLAEGMRDRP